MKLSSSVFVLVLLYVRADSNSNSNSNLFPQGYQWNYSYYALLKSGSLLPTEAHSQWDLRGLLTITSTIYCDNCVIAQLSQFNTSIFNGLKDDVPQDLKPAPVPSEALTLGIPFVINYSGTEVESISVNKNDPLWSVNIKRVIASILQLKIDQLDTPASFISENNIYGNCEEIEYSVVNNTEYVYVRKVIDHLKCNNFPTQQWSSVSKFMCSGVEENPFTATTTREYTLKKRDNSSYEIKHVISNRRFYIQPFQAQAEAQQIYQFQNYQLLSVTPVKNTNIPEQSSVKRTLLYEYDPVDITHGRFQRVDTNKFLLYINSLLNTLVQNLEEESILINDITNLHRTELTHIYYSLSLLKADELKQLYSDISIGTSYQQETKLNIFFELLPQIGTEECVNFMKELIIRRELKGFVPIKMLSVYPFYVRRYSTKLLNDLEVLLSLSDNYESQIRYTAILSFSTLVYKTYEAGECTLEIFDNYVLKYFDLFSESTDYEKRMIYLQGLNNLQLGSVSNYLSSIILNNEQSRHIRFSAALASMSSASSLKSKEIYEVHWPILTDRTQQLEMRSISFLVLLAAQPTRSRLLTLFWYMQAEQDPHLYNMFYTTFVSLQNTQHPCFKQLGNLVSHVVRLLRPPITQQYWSTGNYILDYTDTERAFGSLWQLISIGNRNTNNPNILYFNVNNFGSEMNLNQIGIYLKLQGIRDNFKELFTNVNKNVEISKLLESIDAKLISPEEMHVEFHIKVQGKTVFCYYGDNNFKKIINDLLFNTKLFSEYHVNYQSIIFSHIREYFEPSDVGTLIMRGVLSNSIASDRGNVLLTVLEQFYTHKFRYSMSTVSFAEVYNPISHIWHGVHKSKSLHAHFFINRTMNWNTYFEQPIREIVEKRNGSEYFHFIFHTLSRTYLINNGTINILQHHCPKCTDEYIINHGPKNETKNQSLVSFENFGIKFKMNLFDCRNDEVVRNLFFNVYSSHRSNTQVIPIAKPILYGMHLIDYVTYISSQSTCGVYIYLESIHKELKELTYKQTSDEHFTSSSLTLERKLSEMEEKQQIWNITYVESLLKAVRHNKNTTLFIEFVNSHGTKETIYVTSQLELLQVKNLFLMKPSEPASILIQATAENGTDLRITIDASVTDEQKLISSTYEMWPFQECRESVQPSFACYLATKEVSTYRKYSFNIEFNNKFHWFIDIIQNIHSFLGLQTFNESKNLTTNINSVVEFSTLKPLMKIMLNNRETIIDYTNYKFIENFLINSRIFPFTDWKINFGLKRLCIVSPNFITTIDNRLIHVDKIKMRTKNRLIVADCSQYSKFALFLDESTNINELLVTIYEGDDRVRIKPFSNKTLAFVSNMKNTNYNITSLGGYTLINTQSIDMYYTTQYMILTIPSSLNGDICGVCTSIRNTLP